MVSNPVSLALGAGSIPGVGLLGAGLGIIGNVAASLIGQNHDRKMWDLMNKYNSPEAQMNRLEKAGLNPNLVYGSGNVVGNSQSQRPITVVPKIETPDFVQMMANYQLPMLRAAQESKALAESKKSTSELDLIAERIKTEIERQLNLNVSSQLGSQQFSQKGSLFPYQLSIKEQEAKNLYPKLVQLYGERVADMAFKVSQGNPAMLDYIEQQTDLAESRTGINQQLYDANQSVGGYSSSSVINFLSGLLKLMFNK